MKKAKIIHPLLFTAFPLLAFLSHNIGLKLNLYGSILIAILISLCFTILLFFMLNAFLKDEQKSAMVTSLFVLLFFSYGHIHEAVGEVHLPLGGFIIGTDKLLILLSGFTFIAGIFIISKLRFDLNNITRILNVVAATVVIIPLLSIIQYQFKPKGDWTRYSNSQNASDTQSVQNTRPMRDIYYIILDAYANPMTLEEVFQYDNREFTDYLKDKGFYMAHKSRSNYMKTFVSLASSLNMQYVNDLTEIAGANPGDETILFEMIKENKVVSYLKSKGYKIINVAHVQGTSQLDADYDIRIASGNEFQMVLIQTTMLKPFVQHFLKEEMRDIVLSTFAKLSEMPQLDGPKFVFAHINSPHTPFVFGPNGEQVQESKVAMTGNAWGETELYLNQLIFITKKVKGLVDDLIAKSDPDPIIIIQSDHGPFTSFYQEENVDRRENPTATNLKECLRNFSAYYLPPQGSDLLYETATPVNNFRIIFNQYFNENYELLEDRSYYSTAKNRYQFTDVTNIVRFD